MDFISVAIASTLACNCLQCTYRARDYSILELQLLNLVFNPVFFFLWRHWSLSAYLRYSCMYFTLVIQLKTFQLWLSMKLYCYKKPWGYSLLSRVNSLMSLVWGYKAYIYNKCYLETCISNFRKWISLQLGFVTFLHALITFFLYG